MTDEENHEEPRLTDADLRAIADIRRELDAEFGALLDAPLPDASGSDEPPPDEGADTPTSYRRARSVRRPSMAERTRRGLVVAFVLGTLAGTGLGCLSVFLWLRPVREEMARVAPPARDPDGTSEDDRTGAAARVVDEVASLQDALDEWMAATERGDITTQMRFYPARVPVYYTWRDVPRDAVRAEKVRVFGAARTLSITTDTPTVEVLDDRVTAITRFRKRYVIEGPRIRRRGEVLQELRWIRTAGGWLIVGERDARVLATAERQQHDSGRHAG